MFERFTEKAIKVIMLAQEEARRLGHNFVGTEQILLGLIGEGTGVAAKVLKSLGVNLKDSRIEVEKIISHRGSGKKQRFLTKWKGSDVKTYEPADNFIKHGGKELLDAYRLSLKKKGRKAQANISITDNPNPPYTDDEPR